MKLPKTFIPEKSLENNVKHLLEDQTKQNEKEEPWFLKGLEIEPGVKKVWFSYEESLERLRQAGYERHLHPWESFELINLYLENELPKNLNRMVNDFSKSYGEWFNIAIKRKNNKIICYTDPQNIKLENDVYIINKKISPKLEYTAKQEFDVTGIPSLEWTKLEKFNNDFIKFFYNRNFEQLPDQIRKGEYTANVILPPEGVLWPASRGDNRYGTFLNIWSQTKTSRGIRKKIKHETA